VIVIKQKNRTISVYQVHKLKIVVNWLQITSMLVYVNSSPVELFRGARVQDAVLRYMTDHNIPVHKQLLTVNDQFGNTLDAEGRLNENQQLFIHLTTNPL